MPRHEPVLSNFDRFLECSDDGLLVAVALQFDEGLLLVEVNPEDDSVNLHLAPDLIVNHCRSPTWRDRTDDDPWRELTGAHCPWRWVLTNQQGYRDGAQVELNLEGRYVVWQWIGEASALRAQGVSSRPSRR